MDEGGREAAEGGVLCVRTLKKRPPQVSVWAIFFPGVLLEMMKSGME